MSLLSTALSGLTKLPKLLFVFFIILSLISIGVQFAYMAGIYLIPLGGSLSSRLNLPFWFFQASPGNSDVVTDLILSSVIVVVGIGFLIYFVVRSLCKLGERRAVLMRCMGKIK